MYGEPSANGELDARCDELDSRCNGLTKADPRELWASELLEAGLIALLEAELAQSVPAALLAAELMDAGWTALGTAELATVTAPDARRPSRAPRRA